MLTSFSPHRARAATALLAGSALAALASVVAACSATAPGGELARAQNGLADASPSPGNGGPPFDATVEGGGGGYPPAPGHPSDASAPDASAPPPFPRDASPTPDADTCGACAGTCFGTRCMVVLASNQVNPGAIAVNAAGVYWVNDGRPDTQYAESAVMTVGLGGGAPATIASTPGGVDHVVVADESQIVWTYGQDILSVQSPPSGSPTALAVGVSPSQLAMDSAGIYWTTTASPYPTAAAWRMDRNGGGQALLMEGAGMPAGILVGDGVVYWQAYGSGTTIYAVRTDGDGGTALTAPLPSGFYPWAFDSSGLYWGDTSDPLEMMRIRADGGPPAVVATEFVPAGMTADEASVYFTNDNSVYALPTDGGAPVALTWRLPSPLRIAVDGTSLYWTDRGTCDASGCSGAVLKLTPK